MRPLALPLAMPNLRRKLRTWNWRLILALAFTVGGWASCTAWALQVTR
jgi:hypothetical protein